MAALATTGIGCVGILGVAYLERELQAGATGFGFMNSLLGLGMAVGGLILGNLAGRVQPSSLVNITMGALGIAITAFALAPTLALVLVTAFIIGLCLIIVRSLLATILQALTPDEKRGRVESAMVSIISISTVISMGLAGFLAHWIGIRQVIILSGVLTLSASFIASRTIQLSVGRTL